MVEIRKLLELLQKFLQPFTSDRDFRSSINASVIGSKFNVFDIRYQKILESAQPIQVEFIFSENSPTGI